MRCIDPTDELRKDGATAAIEFESSDFPLTIEDWQEALLLGLEHGAVYSQLPGIPPVIAVTVPEADGKQRLYPAEAAGSGAWQSIMPIQDWWDEICEFN